MPKKSIPEEVQEQVRAIVNGFNRDVFADSGRSFIPRFKGNHLYLDMEAIDSVGPICRLKYTGDMKKWQFAIYKFSSGQYDPEEWFFPGEEFVDGTVEGAMKAGAKAYD